jgi:hypothetical protein
LCAAQERGLFMPEPVDRYFKDVKKNNPSYSDEQAWATAWSIYCKHKNPGSEHCTKDRSEYLTKSAGESMSIIHKVAAKYAEEQMVARVASRAIQALAVGKTFESDKWRVHRYRDILSLTHLENAGKRGKKCQTFSLDFWTVSGAALMESVAMEIADLAKKNVTLGAMEKALHEQVQDFEGGVKLSTSELRGVDVVPAGFGPLHIVTKKIDLTVEMDGFSVRDMSEAKEYEVDDGLGGKKKEVFYPNMPTCIPTTGSKKGLPVFYRWIKDNESKVKSMSYEAVIETLKDLGIPYHTYCAMD